MRTAFILPLAAILAGVAIAQDDNSTSTDGLNGWYDCAEYTFQDEAMPFVAAECAQFTVPLCHPDVCQDPDERTIQVFVKRIQASDPVGKPNVWFLQGGPGAGSTAMESAMESLSNELYGEVNVYTMDHRGTGRSNMLACVAAQADTSGSPSGRLIDASEVEACALDLHTTYGNLSAFSVTSAASDLAHFISTYQADTQVFVYGVSYGTTLVERLMHLNVSEIAGYILDGISTTSGSDIANFEYFSSWDTTFGEVADGFLEKCAEDSICSSHFSTQSLPDTLKSLYAAWDADSYSFCGDVVQYYSSSDFSSQPMSYFIRSVLGYLFMDDRVRSVIPAMVYRFNRCNDNDRSVLGYFFNVLGTALSTSSEDDAFMSTMLYQLIMYSEMWETPTPSVAVLEERFKSTLVCNGGFFDEVEKYCAFTQEISDACSEINYYSTDYPIKYEKDQYWNVAASLPSSVSVLLMSSKMDPQTAHKFAEYLFDALDAENKELVTFESSSHGTLWRTTTSMFDSTTCGMNILVSYVKNGGDLSLLDKSCMSELPALSFDVSYDIAAMLLSTEDAYNGYYDSSLSNTPMYSDGTSTSDGSEDSDKYKTVFFVVMAVAVVAIIIALVFIQKWRNAKTAAQGHHETSVEVTTPGATTMTPTTTYQAGEKA